MKNYLDWTNDLEGVGKKNDPKTYSFDSGMLFQEKRHRTLFWRFFDVFL